ncbi:hypothetical protein KIW84_023297 [Lathyrus oleraceus]|uniref:Uncharacterized protein n=1 Tax=Pisum sativum TaxID=3888 RepID=A0A9D4YF66_PEA|nr:hypothetical protein KIW84_023297 [Pisum sativum]
MTHYGWFLGLEDSWSRYIDWGSFKALQGHDMLLGWYASGLILSMEYFKGIMSKIQDYFPYYLSIASSDEIFSESSLSSSSYISLPEEAYTENILPSVASLASSSRQDNFDTDLDVDFSSDR